MPIQLKTCSILIFLAVVVLGVYANSLSNAFVWDDEEQIVNNQVIRDINNLPQILTSSTFTTGGGGLSGSFYRPLVSLFYFLNYQIWGPQSWGFHLFQIIFHLANVVLVYLLLEKILSDFGISHFKESAFLTTLIFAVHPANVESVAYIGGIAEILYAFFILLAFYILISGLNLGKGIIGSKFFYWSMVFSFFGLLAKESAVAIFPIMALYLYLLFKPSLKFWLKYFIPSSLFVIGFDIVLRTFEAHISFNQPNFSPITQNGFIVRLLTLPYEFFYYFKTIFFPYILATSQQFTVNSLSDIRFWGPFLVLVFIGFLVFIVIKKQRQEIRKPYFFFIFWFFAAIFPALNIVIPLDMTAAERWLYFPMIGVIALVSASSIQVIKRFSLNWRRLAFVFLGIVIIALSVRTIVRNADWRNGLTLFSHDIKYSKGSFNLENNIGVELFRAGKIDEAVDHFRKSIVLQSRWSVSQNNLGAILERNGDLDGALAQYKKAIEISDYYLAYENLANLLLRLGKTEEAKIFMENALKKLPYNINLNMTLAVVYYQEGRIGDTIALLERVLRADPRNVQAQKFYLLIQSGQKIQFK